MKIKAQGLLNGAEWVLTHHGEPTLAEILAQCQPSTRERYMSAIAIEWHPMEEFCDFLEQSERVLGGPPGAVSMKIGTAGAQKNMGGWLSRAAFYIVRPDYALNRIAAAWRQFNDEGEMVVRALDQEHAEIEVKGVPSPHRLFCATLTGWCEVVSEKVGAVRPKAQHVECRARGDHRCYWRVGWAATS